MPSFLPPKADAFWRARLPTCGLVAGFSYYPFKLLPLYCFFLYQNIGYLCKRGFFLAQNFLRRLFGGFQKRGNFFVYFFRSFFRIIFKFPSHASKRCISVFFPKNNGA